MAFKEIEFQVKWLLWIQGLAFSGHPRSSYCSFTLLPVDDTVKIAKIGIYETAFSKVIDKVKTLRI